MLNIVCQLPIIFIFYLQLQSVNPFGLGDSPGVFNEKLKTFLSGLDKVCGIFYGVINGLFNRSRCKDNSKLTRKKNLLLRNTGKRATSTTRSKGEKKTCNRNS